MKRNETHKYWKFGREYGVAKKSLKKKIWNDIFLCLTLEWAKQILVLNCFKGQLMKPKIVLLKLMTTIFLQLINQWYK